MTKGKHVLLGCLAILPDEVESIVISLHVISGSYYTSGFCDHGKEKLLAKVAKDCQERELLGWIGESLVG